MPKRVNVAVAISFLVSGCSADKDDAQPLEASFDYRVEYDTPNVTSCFPRFITFTDTSRGEPTSWSWAFPDGTTAKEPSPTVKPADAQEFTAGEVTLTVRRGDEKDTATDRVEIVAC